MSLLHFANPFCKESGAEEARLMGQHSVASLTQQEGPSVLKYLLDWIAMYRSGRWADLEEDPRRPFPYTGSSGICYALVAVYSLLKGRTWPPAELCDESVEDVVEELRASREWVVEEAHTRLTSSAGACSEGSRRAFAYLDGNMGVVAASSMAACVLPMKKSGLVATDACLGMITKAVRAILEGRVEDEMYEGLYGTGGVLFATVLVNRCVKRNTPDTDHIPQKNQLGLVAHLIRVGVATSEREKSSWPLLWHWHNRDYLGMAHGTAGILFAILHVPGVFDESENPLYEEHEVLVRGTLDCILALEEDGHYPSACSGGSVRVHWCHGSGGMVFLLCKAFEVFGDLRFLEAALRCGETIWREGLLKKGPGLCHGVSGSGFGLLRVHKMLNAAAPGALPEVAAELADLTDATLWLWRAHRFAEFMFKDLDKESGFLHQARQPDRPASLYEGWAGAGPFLVALLQPEDPLFGGFPLFE